MKFDIYIPINPENYSLDIISKLEEFYSSNVTNTLNICLMGKVEEEYPKIEKIVRKFNIDTNLLTIPCFGFNYSYAVNYMVQHNIEEQMVNQDQEMVILDGWTIASLYFFEKKSTLDSIDFDKSFLIYNIIRDEIKDEEFDFSSKRIMLSLSSRIGKNMRLPDRPKKLIPVPILKTKTFIEINGLEENLFTDYSRLVLINKLKMKENIEPIEIEKTGIRLSYNPIFSKKLYDQDIEIYKRMNDDLPKGYILPNNFNETKFGDPEKRFRLKVENNILFWNSASNNVTNIDIELNKKKDIYIPEDIKEDKIEKDPDKADKLLILVDSDFQSIYKASKFIKKLYLQYNKKVTILTNSTKLDPINHLNSFMVDRILDYQKISSEGTNFNKEYDIIYCINNSSLLNKIKSNKIQTVNDNIFEDFSSYYSIQQPLFKLNVDENCICINASVKPEYYKNIDSRYWEMLNTTAKSLTNLGIPVLGLSVKDEREIIPIQNLKKSSKNFHCFKNFTEEYYTKILSRCKYVITHPYNDIFWVSRLIHKPGMVISYTDDIIESIESNFKRIYYLEKNVFDIIKKNVISGV